MFWVAIFFSAVSLLGQFSTFAADSRCPSPPGSLPDLVYLGVPDRCIEGTDGSKCDIFLRMAPNRENNTFVDFYMEGNMTGWVAVGFSVNEEMVYTDVIGCKHDEDDRYSVLNAWNPNVKPKHNELNPSQDLTCNYGTRYEDKRLICHFGRSSTIINPGYDFNLNGTYYIILGNSAKQTPADEAFPFHTVIPTIMKEEINVYNHRQK